VVPPLEGPYWGYRRKARLGVKYVPKKGGILVGFREKQGHLLAEIDTCAVLLPVIGEKLPRLKTLIGQLTAYAAIPQIEVSIGEDGAALVLRHLVPLSTDDKAQLMAFAQAENLHLYLQPGDLASTYRLWPAVGPERLFYRLPDFDLTLYFHPHDFIQVNGDVNRLMIQQAIDWLDLQASDRVLDLFCGLGNFALPMARISNHVVGIEGSPAMVARAEENADYNDISHAQFFTADLTNPAITASWLQARYDKVLLDPPRLGAAALLPLFQQWAPHLVVYVSCNPATLARDVGILQQAYGYRLKKVGVVDLFPHTTHIESMALLEREQ